LKICRTKEELFSAVNRLSEVGFVPTMGALHDGHLALVRAAAEQCSQVVASIFVNPTQFAPHEDLSTYPRNEDLDKQLLESAGCHVVFLPDTATVYGGSSTKVRVEGVSSRYEGEFRPTHFEGVATVVTKLFGLVQPQRAYFGTKDLQQCAVINRLVRDLFLPVELKFVETVREPSGLARSSRNAYLSGDERQAATAVIRVLTQCCEGLRRSSEEAFTGSILEDSRKTLADSGFAVDYLDLVDPQTMEPLNKPSPGSRVVVAARLGKVRLLDNISVYGTPLQFTA
jgi:pantoate--beta-alanine ligase